MAVPPSVRRSFFKMSREKRAGSKCEPAPVGLESGNVCGLQTLWTTSDFKLNRLAFVQRFVSISLNGGEMYEYIFAGLALDESKALAGVKPFYGSLFFHGSSFAVD
jgi:hypothetical protein